MNSPIHSNTEVTTGLPISLYLDFVAINQLVVLRLSGCLTNLSDCDPLNMVSF